MGVRGLGIRRQPDRRPPLADASFRRYFRVTRGEDTYIVMDAPPEKESLSGRSSAWRRYCWGCGLNVPVVLARDSKRGLLLLSDLGASGNTSKWKTPGHRRSGGPALRDDALDALAHHANRRHRDITRDLPHYSHDLLMREMELMPEWFLQRLILGCRSQPPNAAC